MTSHLIDIKSFFEQMANPDADYSINEVNKVTNQIIENQRFSVPIGMQEIFLDTLIANTWRSEYNSDANKDQDLRNALFRLIILVARYIELGGLETLIKGILALIQEPECSISSQLISLLKEIMSEASTYTPERRKMLFNCLHTHLIRDIATQRDVALSNAVDLMSSLLDTLGGESTPDQISQIITKIKPIMDRDRHIVILISSWVSHADEHAISSLLEALDDKHEVKIEVLTACVKKSPRSFRIDKQNVFEYLRKCVQSLLESDEENDTRLADLILCFNSLYTVFSDDLEKDVDYLLELSLSCVCYNLITIDDDDDDLSDWSDGGVLVETSWAVRRAASMLLSTLCRKSTALVKEMIEENFERVSDSLRDSDASSRRAALDFLLTAAQTHAVRTDIINKWSEIASEQIQKVPGDVCRVLSGVSQAIGGLSIKASNTALTGLASLEDRAIPKDADVLVSELDSKKETASNCATVIMKMLANKNYGCLKSAIELIANVGHFDRLPELLNVLISKSREAVHPYATYALAVYLVKCGSHSECLEAVINSSGIILANSTALISAASIPLPEQVYQKLEDLLDGDNDECILWSIFLLVKNHSPSSYDYFKYLSLLKTVGETSKVLSLRILAELRCVECLESLGEIIAVESQNVTDAVTCIIENIHDIAIDAVRKFTTKLIDKKIGPSVAGRGLSLNNDLRVEIFQRPSFRQFDQEKEEVIYKCRLLANLGPYIDLSSETELINNIMKLIDMVQNRDVLHAACDALGGITAGSTHILSIIQKNSVRYLPVVLSFSKRIPGDYDHETIDKVAKWLIETPDLDDEVSSEALANLGIIKESILEYFTRSYTCTAALRKIFKTKRTKSLLIKSISLINPKEPALTRPLLLLLNDALKSPNLQPYLLDTVPIVLECVIWRQEHMREITYAMEKKSVDIGWETRLSGIEFLANICPLVHEQYLEKLEQVTSLTIDDAVESVRVTALKLINQLAKRNRGASLVDSVINNIKLMIEGKDTYWKALYSLQHVATDAQLSKIDELIKSNNVAIEENETISISTRKNVMYDIMNEYCPEAAHIFL